MKLFADIGQQALQGTETPERRDIKKVSPVIAPAYFLKFPKEQHREGEAEQSLVVWLS